MSETVSIMPFVLVGGIMLICLIGFIAWIWAIIETLRSDETDGSKIGWTLLLILLPFIGLIIWLFAGPRAKKS